MMKDKDIHRQWTKTREQWISAHDQAYDLCWYNISTGLDRQSDYYQSLNGVMFNSIG